jgi:hypothetical protein
MPPPCTLSPISSQREYSAEGKELLLNSLPPPPPYTVLVSDLGILAPPSDVLLPLPFAISIPEKWAFWSKERHLAASKEIIRNIDLECKPGELLAMSVHRLDILAHHNSDLLSP